MEIADDKFVGFGHIIEIEKTKKIESFLKDLAFLSSTELFIETETEWFKSKEKIRFEFTGEYKKIKKIREKLINKIGGNHPCIPKLQDFE